MRRLLSVPALALALVAFFAACTTGPEEFPAADFTLKSPVTGRATTFSTLKGRPVVLYWFTSW